MWGVSLGQFSGMILFAGFSAFAVFLGIAALGFLVLLISFVAGELFDLGDLLGHHDVDIHGEGPSLFSSRILSVFVTAFGGFGAIGIHAGYSLAASTAMGLASGLAFGGLLYLFVHFLHTQQASSDVRISELAGRTAEVSVGIPRGGVGQVRCTLGESVVEKIARSKDGGEIAANTVVRIEEVVGETVLVRRAE